MATECRKILFLTGTRADFGKMQPLIKEVERSEFEPYLFVTGMHTLARYGSTVTEVRRAGFKNIYTFINQDGSVNSQMDLVLAHTIQGLGHYVRELRPHLLVVHGDRIEALAGAIVGALNNTLVAHIEGGELSGTVDELIRHSVTKLSHLHFVANEEARKRLIQMGEVASSIFVIGSPDIDIMLSGKLPALATVKQRYEIKFRNYLIFLYHPVTTELEILADNIDSVVDALIESGLDFVGIYPNNDKGSEVVLKALQARLERNEHFRLLPSMRFEYFLTLLKNARAVVGNSSAGIREAPVYGVPTINIGTRQKNRFNYPSIMNVSEHVEDIIYALKTLPEKSIPSTHFGSGESAKRFIEVLRSSNFWKTLHQKQFKDLPVEFLALYSIKAVWVWVNNIEFWGRVTGLAM